MKLKNKIQIFLALFFVTLSASAQRPDWSVNAVNYNYSMSYIGVVYLDFEKMEDENSMIAAFVGDEIRGVAGPVFDEQLQNWTYYLLCYSNVDFQTLRFKYYSSIDDAVITFEKLESFVADAIIGSPFDPYFWATPELDGAEMEFFEIEGQVSSEINNLDINVVLGRDVDLEQAVANFQVSGGAIVKVNDVIQVSGITVNDFSGTVNYNVTSSDNNTTNDYIINIIINDLETVLASKIVSPNGDGINDVWIVEDVEKFKESIFYIMDSYGHKIYESIGYDNSWDASYKNEMLPTGTYFYIIKVPSGKTLSGTISIVH